MTPWEILTTAMCVTSAAMAVLAVLAAIWWQIWRAREAREIEAIRRRLGANLPHPDDRPKEGDDDA